MSKSGLIHLPDVNRVRTQDGFVHLHSVSDDWDGSCLIGRRILFSKFSEREFELDRRPFCIVDERDVLALFTRRTRMLKTDFLTEINTMLGTIEGNDLSANDLTEISENVADFATSEEEVEGGGDDIEGTGEEAEKDA